MNSLHPCLTFTCDVETDGSLPFLDVLVRKQGERFLTTVYRKPSFTGEYIRWNSFCDTRRKINLIKTLTHRALKICSKEMLEPEVKKIIDIFRENGYPDRLVATTIKRKVEDFQQHQVVKEGPHKCPVYIRLPYIGKVTELYKKRICNTVRNCFFAVNPRVLISSKPILPSSVKDVLPSPKRSQLVYLFTCCCDSKYVGKTSQRLQARIKQHVPRSLKAILGKPKPPRMVEPTSAIGRHLVNNIECGQKYNEDMFTVLTFARTSFHLQVLEALHITKMDPILCRQKQFVYSLLLFNNRGVQW